MNIYTPAIRAEVHAVRVPLDFVMDVVEYPFHPPFVGLRFYETQWKSYNDAERLKCINYLQRIKNIIEQNGVLVTLEPVSDGIEL